MNLHKYLLAGTLAVVFWSTSFVGTKMAYESFPPLTLGAARFIVASLVLGAFLLIKKEFVLPPKKDLLLMSISGLLGVTIYFAMENVGVQLTTASNAALIIASYPAITAGFEVLLKRSRVSWIKVIGIVITIVGVYQISSSNEGGIGEGQLAGNILLIGAGVVWVFYNFITRRFVNQYSMITVSFYQTISGTLAFIPLAVIERGKWQIPSLNSWIVMLYLGVFCSVIAFMLYNYALRKLSPSTAVTLMNLVPVFGVVFSWMILNEQIHASQLVGGMIVIVGVVLSMRTDTVKLPLSGTPSQTG
ncbi:MAG: transporter family protein [Brevibacillus sp.]|nr:transporter family protein [Brevibacillus sp.]